MQFKQWINPLFVGLLIIFSVPVKLPALQVALEGLFNIHFPIRLSPYTLFLPPLAILCIIWNRKRATEIWNHLRLPLMVLAFLFVWMWLGSFLSEYPKIALKHSGRYTIYLLTFIALLFALDQETNNRSIKVVIITYTLFIGLTFLDNKGYINIPLIIKNIGLHIDLYNPSGKVSSFFENPNPYSIVSVGMFFFCLYSFKMSWLVPSLGLLATVYSVIISGSRNGLLTLSICLFFLFILFLFQIRKSKTQISLLLISICIVGSGLYFIKNITLGRTQSSLNKLLKVKKYDDLKKVDVRFLIYQSAFEVGLNNRSMFGSGTKTFGYEVIGKSKPLARFNNEWYKQAFNSHNSLLTIWIEMGYIGLIMVIVFLWLWFKPALRAPPLVVMPILAVCIGQILDYFVWEILFMAFQSFFFASFAAVIYFNSHQDQLEQT